MSRFTIITATFNIIILSLLFLVVKSEDIVSCDTESQTTNSTEITQQLYEWCLTNSICKDAYYQKNTNQNYTLFRYMVYDIIGEYNYLEEPLDTIVCGNRTDAAILKDLWMLILLSKIENRMVCDINHKLVIDKNGLTSTCICKEGEKCESTQNQAYILHIVMYLLLAITILIMLTSCFNLMIEIRRGKKSDKKKN